MRRAFAAAAIGCLAVLQSANTAALAQSQPFVISPPGTRVYTTTGGWYEVDFVDGMVVRTVNERLDVGIWTGLCDRRSSTSATKLDERSADALWPLELGKSVSYEVESGERRWSKSLRVAKREKITLPAGTFDTWVIEDNEKGISHDSQSVFQCWYAPEVGFVVRRRHEVKGGTGATQFTALRIEKQDRSKTAEFRGPLPGTTFDTSRGSFRVDAVEGTTLIRKSDDPRLNAIWLGGLHDTLASDPFVGKISQEMAKLWPLEIGKSISFDFSRPSGGVWVNRVSVERTESIKVPAGTYATFLVKWQERAVNGPFNATYLYWWSPALGFPIKREVQFSAGDAVRTGYELRKVTPPAK